MQETAHKIPKISKLKPVIRSWVAKPVLALEYTEDPVYIEFYAATLREKKFISSAAQSVSKIFPGFNHLKRCSNQKVLLCPVEKQLLESGDKHSKSSPNILKSLLQDRGFNLSWIKDELEVILVPSKPPETKAQASIASEAWPINFHPDIRLESIISGKELSDDQLNAIEFCMRVVIEAAEKESIGNENCAGSALILDPEHGRILSLAAAKLNIHPMWHPSMLAIDLVAKLQGGGAWDLFGEKTKKRISCDRSNETRNKKLGEKRQFEEESPIYYPPSLSNISLRVSGSSLLEKSPRGRKSSGKSEGKIHAEQEGPYLCTGYWAILLQEPCSLCAMALLHSRIARVFYGRVNDKAGVLGTKTVLHSLSGLNHRYQVWRGILETECTQVSREIV